MWCSSILDQIYEYFSGLLQRRFWGTTQGFKTWLTKGEQPRNNSAPAADTWSQIMTGFKKTATNQFVVFTGEFGKPLVKLQHGYNGHQIPEMQDTVQWFRNIKLSRFRLNVGLLLQTHTCSQDGWSPASWAPWCLGLNRWCPRPGGQIKSYCVKVLGVFLQHQSTYGPSCVDTDPLHLFFIRQAEPIANTPVHLREPTWREREREDSRPVSTDNAKTSQLVVVIITTVLLPQGPGSAGLLLSHSVCREATLSGGSMESFFIILLRE